MALRILSRLLGRDDAPPDGATLPGEVERADLLGRSVRWRPLVGSHAGLADGDGPYDLFVAQSVLRRTRAHLEGAGLDELYGFLYGRVVEDDRGGFVVVEGAVAAEEPMPRPEEAGRFLESLKRARESESEARRIVGWYHNHRLLGLQLTEQDAEIHLAHFSEPWQCALVLIPDGEPSRGAFFQRRRGQRYFRRAVVPFHEVADDGPDVASGGRPFPTCVDWKNYVTSAPVTLSGSGTVSELDRDTAAPDSVPSPPEGERSPPGGRGGHRLRRTTRPVRPAPPLREAPPTATEAVPSGPRGEPADSPQDESAARFGGQREVPLLLPPNSYPTLWDRVRRFFRFR